MTLGQRIIDSFKRMSDEARASDAKASKVIVPTEVSPPVRYVNALLSEMAETRRSVTLRTSGRLPAPSGIGSELPQFAQVVNRLKIMAGLNPVAYSEVVRRQFEVTINERKRKVSVAFDDRGSDPSCQVALLG